ncbi:MAG: glycosyl hydrolase 108 family protein [candidate division KSB1 bacterium]|nr:glycosyl hydrolase 108 family protein [candidate division KSB1 bacterium]
MANFLKCFENTMINEGYGTYTNDPTDHGGETRWGISKSAHPDIDIKNLDREGAMNIYRHEYWNPVKGDKIKDQLIAALLFDTAVLSGVFTATKLAQIAANCPPIDGIMGPVTLSTLNNLDHIGRESFFFASRFPALLDTLKSVTNPPDRNAFFWAG